MTEPIATRCIICTQPIPGDRERKRANTCSEDCRKALRRARARKKMVEGPKCRLCGAPSSPEERMEFLQWRRERKEKPQRGRPKKAPVADPTGTEDPTPALQAAIDAIAESERTWGWPPA